MKSPCATLLLVLGLLGGCSEDWGSDQHGRPIAARQLEGRWLLINYWAEWCGPCRTEIPQLNELARSHPDIVVLGVNFDGLQGEALVKAAQALGIEFRVLADDPAERLGLPRSAGLPATYLVDADGRMRERLMGEQTAAGLGARLAQLKTGK
ncbi:TlpA family protein disulfide reductase [Azomonas macrocytogenes]|uniref:Thiol-disulfide isomerase/thioredoxin n=1 Tax=Azomonas macrocytogenes TaxID=69962 RepID=A0A839SZW7_AZOMA|nr:TlpA disulfide reductase family protein [Azomonas macrocytogenes]MBB3102259.1 thiol-disulfide isomerase/thioredoxin [Azomonas macrocytogenes]